MNRRITGFHLDPERHWVAELECGHTQHVRHDPPWQLRPWVLEEETRRNHLGTELRCLLCDAGMAATDLPPPGLDAAGLEAYRDARLRGLCHDGALEVARSRVSRSPGSDEPPPA